jgi:hypothetical protein
MDYSKNLPLEKKKDYQNSSWSLDGMASIVQKLKAPP